MSGRSVSQGEQFAWMPVLLARNHLHPRRGACLLEVASVLSGEPWTDHPGGVTPVLARVGRVVNDRSTSGARQRLLPLAPFLLADGTRQQRLSADREISASLARGGRSRPVDLHLARLAAQEPTTRIATSWWWLRLAASARRRVRQVAALSSNPPERDDLLRDVLEDAIEAARRVLPGRSPSPSSACSDPELPDRLPVHTHLHRVDEIYEVHVVPVLDGWPGWLRPLPPEPVEMGGGPAVREPGARSAWWTASTPCPKCSLRADELISVGGGEE